MSNGNSSSNNLSNLLAAFILGLTLLFIALKLTKVISWSWLWVLSPVFVPSVVIAFLLIPIIAVSALMKWRGSK